MQVREVMTKTPAVCTPQTSLQDVARQMVESDCGAIPIVENTNGGRAVGIITDRDITTRIVARGQNPLEKTAADAMTDSVVSVRPDDSTQEAVRLMEKHQLRRLIVADGNEQVIGIVAQADLARNVSDEVTGEVVEEISKPSRVSSESMA